MEVKQIPSKLYYCAEKYLIIPEIPGFAEEILDPLYKDAESLGLELNGATEFIYFNSDGNLYKPFQLIIAFPVKESKPSKSDFFFLESMPFSCVSLDYKGPMTNIGKAWGDLVRQALNQGYQLISQGREVYKKWVSYESEENITELQMEIVAKKII